MFFELSAAVLAHEPWTTRGLTWLAQAIDGTIVEAMRVVVDRALLPPPGEVPRMRESAAPYVTGELTAEPARFFAFPDATLAPVAVRACVRRRLPGGTVQRHRLDAALAPWSGATDEVHDTIRLEHWAHEVRQPRAVVLAMHGLLIVAGRGDRIVIVPPEHQHALWRHWGEPRIHWFSGGHLTPFGRTGIAQAITKHLARLDRLDLG